MRVICLIGEAGSGKSTVADWLRDNKGYVQLALADRMKVYVRDAYGIPPLNLWGPSEHRKEVITRREEEWYPYLKNFIDVSKSFVFDLFPKENPDLTTRAIEGLWNLFGAMKLQCDEGRLTARTILQLLGTEWGRYFDKNLWLNLLYEKAIPSIGVKPLPYLKQIPGAIHPDTKTFVGVVVPDNRFENEMAYALDKGYELYRVRLDKPFDQNIGGVENHSSEQDCKIFTDPRVKDLVLPYGLENAYKFLEETFCERGQH